MYISYSLVGSWATPLKNMKVSWDGFHSQDIEKIIQCSKPATSSYVSDISARISIRPPSNNSPASRSHPKLHPPALAMGLDHRPWWISWLDIGGKRWEHVISMAETENCSGWWLSHPENQENMERYGRMMARLRCNRKFVASTEDVCFLLHFSTLGRRQKHVIPEIALCPSTKVSFQSHFSHMLHVWNIYLHLP